MIILSTSERDLLRRSIAYNIRHDGRSCDAYRPPRIEAGILSQCDGSARCRLGDGTDVLVSIRAELAAADLNNHGGDRGKIICNVDWYSWLFCLVDNCDQFIVPQWQIQYLKDVEEKILALNCLNY